MSFLAALHFLTTIPIAPRRHFTDAQLGASLAYYPIVGALIGLMLVGVRLAFTLLFTASIGAVLTLAMWVLVTGGLHLDGFMDACDGLFSHRSTEERLRIMRDVHVGAWGVLGVVLLLVSKLAALPAVSDEGLLLAPTLARWALSLSVVVFPYGRPEGWGKTLKERSGPRPLVVATLMAFALVLFFARVGGLVAFACVLISTLLIARFALDRLPGLTGDVYGMIAEVGEVVVLLVFAARAV